MTTSSEVAAARCFPSDEKTSARINVRLSGAVLRISRSSLTLQAWREPSAPPTYTLCPSGEVANAPIDVVEVFHSRGDLKSGAFQILTADDRGSAVASHFPSLPT